MKRVVGLGAVVVLATALTGVSQADVSTPVADIGSFGGSTTGLAGCWGVHSSESSDTYCLVAYLMPGDPARPNPLRLVAWDSSKLLEQRLPASDLQYGINASGVATATLVADTGDADFGTINVTVEQSAPLTTYDEVPNLAGQAVDEFTGSTPVDPVLPELYTSTQQPLIAPSPCTGPISTCLFWDSGTINNLPVFGVHNWLWGDGPASGGWNVVL